MVSMQPFTMYSMQYPCLEPFDEMSDAPGFSAKSYSYSMNSGALTAGVCEEPLTAVWVM